MPAKTSEAKIEKKVVAYCKERGLYCRKFSSPARRGVPDRIICGTGKVFFLELKRPGEEPSKLQNYEMGLLRGAGMIANWADSFARARYVIDDHFFPPSDLI